MGYVPDDATDAMLKAPIVEAPVVAEASVEPEAWSTGLFECVAPGGGALCCVSACMPFVQFGILAEQLPKGSTCLAGSFGCATAAFLGLEMLAAAGGCMVVPGVSLLPISALVHHGMRRHIREKYNIKGSCCRDLCTAWWCGPCALAQETREVVIRSAAQRSGSPASLYAVGNLLLPPPAYAVAVAECAPAATANPLLQPATGVPVPSSVPPTQVATVTLASAK
ncbi:Cell number regulator 11 [Tetrabaena socialis]|uniref:Cell number regulator 11 n=1 Tax=Tetrabaena socialis TaxID=47790 RepID=A0A2J8A9V6_9CHLO|nr:Cell number regulator 11 [Tetrabaena socialis]|eukprot:PNH09306.1 Cell number regulator 11 [Tetrabaena socialis]